MRPNPLHDAGAFLTKTSWLTPVFWLLLIAAAAIAFAAWRRNPASRTPRDGALALLRFLVGVMWWQQSLWKVPPNYGGLIYWMKQMVAHAAIPAQGDFVGNVIIPNITIVGPLVYAGEVAVAVSLMLGLLSRLGGRAGAGDGAQSVARRVFDARRMAVDVFFSRAAAGVVRDRPAGPMPRRGRAAGPPSQPRAAPAAGTAGVTITPEPRTRAQR